MGLPYIASFFKLVILQNKLEIVYTKKYWNQKNDV